jgi:hypothetical protein
LCRIRSGTLSKNANSQASNHEIGIERSHSSHCASDIRSNRRPVNAAGTIRSANAGASVFIWA